jgi:hypothetical protein
MKVLAIACVTVPAIVVSAAAQQAGIKRTVLRSIDFPAGYTTVTAIVELTVHDCSRSKQLPRCSARVREGALADISRRLQPSGL